MISFDKTACSKVYSPVLSHASNSSDNPDQELRFGSKWYNATGWRAGALLAALLATASLLLNLAVIIWASKTHGTASAIVEVLQGDCKKIQKANTWIHLGINIISAALLSGSNYYMQCLSAPTRKEVNKAHTQGRWVDIGMPSVRNLRSISWKNAFFWWFLGLLSIPLHLI